MPSRVFCWVFILCATVFGLAACRPYDYHGTVVNPPKPIDDFSAQTADGEEYRFSQVETPIQVFYFGYTYCPDICPTTLFELHQAREALDDQADKVQVVFVAVDPARDTPDQMRSYLEHIDPSFIGLYEPDPAKLAALAEQFGVYYQPGEPQGASGNYMVDHTTAMFAVDQTGWRLVWSFGTTSEDITQDLQALLREQ